MTRLRSVPGPVRVRVPAKINLYLACGDRRSDGYHDLVTVFSSVDLCDEVVIAPAPRQAVATTGVGAGLVPSGAKNLASAAARLLAKRTKSGGPVAIEINKQIPVAGGMAGGSADAAATLVGCAALWGLELSRDQLADLAAELGADVPFSLTGGTAIGTGRGDRLSPVLARTPLHWVLAFSATGLSTPEVFAELDRLRDPGNPNGAPRRVGDVARTPSRRSDPVTRLGSRSLWPTICSRPRSRCAPNCGARCGPGWRPVPWAEWCPGRARPSRCCARMPRRRPMWRPSCRAAARVRSVRIASGPVPGARVVD